MTMKQEDAPRRDNIIERWANALGVSKERLRALVQEVVNERQCDPLGAAAGSGEDRPSHLDR